MALSVSHGCSCLFAPCVFFLFLLLGLLSLSTCLLAGKNGHFVLLVVVVVVEVICDWGAFVHHFFGWQPF